MRDLEGHEALSLSQMVEQGLVRYIDFPDDLKGRYQSYTQADASALRATGFDQNMRDVKQGVAEYVRWRFPDGRALKKKSP